VLLLLVYKIADEWAYALRQRWKYSRKKKAAATRKNDDVEL
jgi:hypothetical protein